MRQPLTRGEIVLLFLLGWTLFWLLLLWVRDRLGIA